MQLDPLSLLNLATYIQRETRQAEYEWREAVARKEAADKQLTSRWDLFHKLRELADVLALTFPNDQRWQACADELRRLWVLPNFTALAPDDPLVEMDEEHYRAALPYPPKGGEESF